MSIILVLLIIDYCVAYIIKTYEIFVGFEDKTIAWKKAANFYMYAVR